MGFNIHEPKVTIINTRNVNRVFILFFLVFIRLKSAKGYFSKPTTHLTTLIACNKNTSNSGYLAKKIQYLNAIIDKYAKNSKILKPLFIGT